MKRGEIVRRRSGLTFSVVSVAFAVTMGGLAVATSAPVGAAPTVTPTPTPTGPTSPVWSAAEQLPGITTLDNSGDAQLKAVSCPAAGACDAAGFYIDGSDHQDQAFVASSSFGGWGGAQQVPLVSQLNTGGNASATAISCVAAGDCGVSGYYADSTGIQTFAGEESGGTWDGSVELPGSENAFGEPISESCPAFARCTIGGFLTDTSGNEQPYVDDEGPSFSWRANPTLTGEPSSGGSATVTSVSCKTAGNCTAGGWYTTKSGQGAFVSNEVNNSWLAADIVVGSLNKGGNAEVSQVSCASPGNCAAVGGYAPAVNQQEPFVKDEKNGKWLAAIPLPGAAALNAGHYGAASSVSCTAPGDCTAEGYYFVSKTDTQEDFVATEKNWTWGSAIEVPGMAALNTGRDGQPGPVSCVSPGTCSAAGEYKASGKLQVWVSSERNGQWAAAKPMLGLISLNAGESQVNGLSCATVTSCGMVGYYTDGHGGQQPFVASGAIAVPTSVLQSVSAHTVVYGHEQAERSSVAVDSQFGAAATGSVAVKAGSVTACVMTLKAGNGSCVVPAAKFGPGQFTLAAFYGGAVQFLGSKSGSQTFTVVKAPTKTSLALSAGKVTFGHEQAEHLTVGVAPRFGGVPAGTVTVTAGTTTVCVITLKAGKGSCTLSSSRLKAGTYHLVAGYHGGTDFNGSSSAAKTLVVTG